MLPDPETRTDDPDGFAPVMITGDETAVAIARSILDGAGVEHRLRGDGYRRFGARTFLGATLPPMMGHVIVEVRIRDFEDAAVLLQGLSGAIPPSNEANEA